MTREQRRSGRAALDTEEAGFYVALGRAVKAARAERGLGRKDLAEAAGISYAYLADIETGRGRPSSKALLAVAEALGLAPHELMRSAEELLRRMRPVPSIEAAPDESPVPVEAAELLETPAVWSAIPAIAAPSRRASQRWYAERAPSPPPPRGPSRGPPREELEAILDRLSPEDLRLILEVARHLAFRRA